MIPRIATILAKSLYVNLLPETLFDPDLSLEKAKALVKRFVIDVEIENHSFCNRTCWFCPNTFIDRRGPNVVMAEDVFERILADLSSIGYSGALQWAGYHEPFAHPSIYARVARARTALPQALLVATSNSDYLDRAAIERMETSGLDLMMLDLYLPDGREEDPDELQNRLRILRQRTGLEPVPFHARGRLRDDVAYRLEGSRIRIVMGVPHFTPETVSTRGGLLDVPKRATYRRRAVCLEPLRHVVIHHDGSGMLCCQTRSDAAEHRDAVIGNLSSKSYSLFSYYRDLASARRHLLAPGAKSGVCASCDVGDAGPDLLARRQWLARLMHGMPLMERAFNRVQERAMPHRSYDTL
jgi:hypothetical protein